MPDEHGDTHPPPPSTAPVVVRPIQPHESRTLRTAFWATFGTWAAAILPTLLSTFLDMIGNPVIASIIANKVPAEYRVGIAIAFSIVIRRFGYLRKVTVAPIVGTPAAVYAVKADPPTPAVLRQWSGPAPTEGGTP